MSTNWRDEVATHLENAANELRTRRDGSFVKSFTVAIGYLEHAARMRISPNAQRVWAALRETMRESENTAQMKLTPEAMEAMARMRASSPDLAADISPPSLPSNLRSSRKAGE